MCIGLKERKGSQTVTGAGRVFASWTGMLKIDKYSVYLGKWARNLANVLRLYTAFSKPYHGLCC